MKIEREYMNIYNRRDLSIVEKFGSSNDVLVVACDSCGGIGIKEHDILKISPYYVGKLTVRVALTEVMCSGAVPFMISSGIASEMESTGSEIIRGIKDELENANLDSVHLTGSTEENFLTSMTAAGITVIGSASQNRLRFNEAKKGDKIILFGKPKVGDEVDLEDTGFYNVIEELLLYDGVHEIIPVGSKGIEYEIQNAITLGGLSFFADNTDIDIKKTAGPSTCIIAICSFEIVDEITLVFPSSQLIGELF